VFNLVVQLLIIGLVGVALFVFRDKIASFASGGLTDAGKNLEQFGKDVETNVNQIGEDIGKFGAEQQANFDQFVLDTQSNIDKIGTDAQANINQFFVDAQSNFESNIAGITKGIDDTGKSINQFGIDIQTNIIKGAEGIQQGFEDFVSNAFGGQSDPKIIVKTITPRDSVNRPARTISQITEKPDILISKDTSVPNVIKPDFNIPLNSEDLDPVLSPDLIKRSQRITRFSR